MLELTWEQIGNESFQRAVVAVNNARTIDAKQVYRAGRICQVARKEAIKIQQFHKELAEKHKDNEEQVRQELDKALSETKVQVNVLPLDWKAIFGKVQLSGLEMIYLEPICENVGEE